MRTINPFCRRIFCCGTPVSFRQRGFTLIEMSVVLLMMGLFLVAGIQIYMQYIRYQQVATTDTNVSLAARSVNEFRQRFGRYPCPAPLTAPKESVDYGREGKDCNEDGLASDGVTPGDELPASLDPNTAIQAGYYVEQSVRTIDTDGDGVDDLFPVVIRGALPFRDLSIPEEYSYDGYGQRIAYAVTQNVTVEDTFNPTHGGITIVDTQAPPQSLIPTPDSGLYVVLSPGENGAGAFTSAGVQVAPCPATGDEAENCNASTTEATYVFAQKNSLNTNDYLDDRGDFFASYEDTLWKIDEDNANYNIDHVRLRRPGKVGINMELPDDPALPQNSLGVDGMIRSTSSLISENICDASNEDCFGALLIAGEIADGDGMECGLDPVTGEQLFMTGIKFGGPDCSSSPEVEIRCPDGERVEGFLPDGRLDCGAPPAGCLAESRDVCGTPQMLAATPVNGNSFVNGGVSRREYYSCYEQVPGSPQWGLYPYRTEGVCTCPGTVQEKTLACPKYYTGKRFGTITQMCPSGAWGPFVETSNTCQCKGAVETRFLDCPAGFNKGKIKQERTIACDTFGALLAPTPWVQVAHANECRCEVAAVADTLQCPSGLTGTYTRTNNFVCPGGVAAPGNWTGYVSDYSTCSCVAGTTRTFKKECPNQGDVGYQEWQDTYICGTIPPGLNTPGNGRWANSPVLINDNCDPPPLSVCVWTPISGHTPTMTKPNTFRKGAECTCGTPNSSCFEAGTGVFHRYQDCACQ